ncbi:MAG: V-type ATP synthase subunit B [Spirochaetota bacterium]|jgi:V/A-type H+-transporting ATPase subunit B|nr:V-type ATP synthase subunit B [Spirochaetota bacterium]
MSQLVYQGLTEVNGPLVVVERTRNVGFGELVRIRDAAGADRIGQVLQVAKDSAMVQVFGGTTGLTQSGTECIFLGAALRIPVSQAMLGRVYNGLGEPRDGAPMHFGGELRDINGSPINPWARSYPRDFIQTGISAIDGMTTLIRGQKLPIFSGNGLPHNRLAAQITRQAKILSADEQFTIVFCAMGIKHDIAQFFIRSFEESGVLHRVSMFLSLADDPTMERLVTPRSALTLAEYLAFDCGMHVLVVMTDMTNYCEALREIAIAKGEIPSRKGYPGYLYSDLSTIYERAGKIKTSKGSITQVPILTMPSDDITHPVPDLTGYITEGQIVLERELYGHSVYPPIAGLPSLSRLMKDGIGAGSTREDHQRLSSQLFAAYSRVKDARSLAAVVGEEELSALEKQYLKFGEAFEKRFLNQGEHEDRSIEQTLDIAWATLTYLPEDELVRVTREQIEKYLPGKEAAQEMLKL